MVTTLRKKNCRRFKYSFNPSVMMLKPVEVCENGRIFKRSSYESFNIAESINQFRASDFSVSALESVGALNQLKTTYMSYTSNLNVADSFDNINITQDVQ